MCKSSASACLVFLVAIAGPRLSAAQESVEGPLVLRLPASPRLLGMANAGAASNDADVLFYNPSMLLSARGMTASMQSYGSRATAGSIANVATTGSTTVAVGTRLLRWESDGRSYGDVLRHGATHLSDIPTGDDRVEAASSEVTLGLARTVKKLRLGLAVKYAEDRLGSRAAGFVAFDLGFSHQVGSTVLSVIAQNLGAGPRMDDVRAASPRRIGVGWGGGPTPRWEHWDLGMQTEITVEGDDWFVRPAGGVELGYVPVDGVSFLIRSGLRMPRERDESLVTAGMGITLDRLSIDYAMEPIRGGRPVSHRIGVRFK